MEETEKSQFILVDGRNRKEFLQQWSVELGGVFEEGCGTMLKPSAMILFPNEVTEVLDDFNISFSGRWGYGGHNSTPIRPRPLQLHFSPG